MVESQRQNGSKYGLNPEMIDGRRITDAPMLDVAVMIYAQTNNIVAQLQP
jgi:acetylglutamate kinase